MHVAAFAGSAGLETNASRSLNRAKLREDDYGKNLQEVKPSKTKAHL